ncbi:unnamed protein product [Phyllotreta striolata]|uniref:RING-type domain-containing protein n=1 Tax=Phyllotreta striolata TaxID=444603 RepID=A0A9N9XSL0_PHYSR|nr:unnamed protein product [Phyllotreta striolata]
MNITCTICSELFINSSDIYFTQCGHVFHYTCLLNWLERSRTCPECRTRTTQKTIHKAYFNVSTLDQTADPATLLHKIDNLNFSSTLKDKEIKNFKEASEKLTEKNRLLREEVAKLMDNERSLVSSTHILKDRLQHYKSKVKETDKLVEEISNLKGVIRSMENAEKVIHGTRAQVEDLLRNEHNSDALALLAATLKKALLDSEKKARDLDYNFKKLKNEYAKLNRTYTKAEAELVDVRKKLLDMKIKNESKALRKRQKLSEENNIILTDPEKDNASLTPPSECDSTVQLYSNQSKDISLNESLIIPKQAENVTNVVNADSPYLPVKKNNYGSLTLNKLPLKEKYSIFKSSQHLSDTKVEPKKDIFYNGLGASQKEDKFPSAKSTGNGSKRKPNSGLLPSKKFKKLAPTSSSNTKITDFVDLSG